MDTNGGWIEKAVDGSVGNSDVYNYPRKYDALQAIPFCTIYITWA